MIARSSLYAVAFLFLLGAACGPPAEQAEPSGGAAASTEADVEAIAAVMDSWAAALNAEDADAMMMLHTEGTLQLPPHEPATQGKEAVRAWFDVMFAAEGAPVFSIQTDEVRVSGDWAVARGSYSWSVPTEEGTMTVPGKWMIVFEREADGAWRAANTIWNLDVPEPAM
ncbi:MAG: SgcJ/EcaC family oxidoreductase [Gemmatimonadota bacterium]|nr:MAG: SgcJ/EcaC family oxidoreductase [Gemmatimonadota bacterium]